MKNPKYAMVIDDLDDEDGEDCLALVQQESLIKVRPDSRFSSRLKSKIS